MSKKLFLRILHVCIRIAVCGLGCMMLTAAIAVVAAPDQSLTQAASKSFLQNETPLLKDQPDFSPEEAVLWKKSSYGAAGYSRMIPAHYFPLVSRRCGKGKLFAAYAIYPAKRRVYSDRRRRLYTATERAPA